VKVRLNLNPLEVPVQRERNATLIILAITQCR